MLHVVIERDGADDAVVVVDDAAAAADIVGAAVAQLGLNPELGWHCDPVEAGLDDGGAAPRRVYLRTCPMAAAREALNTQGHCGARDWQAVYTTACAQGALDTVKYMRRGKVERDAVWGARLCGLMARPHKHHLAVAAVLLQEGVDPNSLVYESDAGGAVLPRGVLPLNVAAGEGDAHACRLLLDHGAAVNGADERGVTPLLAAVRERHEGAAALLLRHGADANAASREDGMRTAVWYAAGHGEDVVLDMLLRHGGDPNGVDEHGTAPLVVAADVGNPDCALALLHHGADPNARDRLGRSAWGCAVRNDLSAVLQEMARRGAEPHSGGGPSGASSSPR